MELRFEQFSEQTDPALLEKAAQIVQGEIICDGQQPFSEILTTTDPTLPNHEVFGLLHDGEVVSTAVIYDAEKGGGSTIMGRIITLFAVHPKYQRRGIGKYMLRKLEQYTVAMGGTELYIDPTMESL